MLDGTRAAVLEGAALADLMGYIIPLLILGIIALPIGIWAFKAAENYAKRSGKLKRVG